MSNQHVEQPDTPTADSPPADHGNPNGVRADADNRATHAHRFVWAWALAAGLFGGLVSWAWCEQVYNTFHAEIKQPPNWKSMSSYERADFRSAEEIRQKPGVGLKNSMLVFGGLGGILSAALGLAGGLARGSVSRALSSSVIGSLIGLLAAGSATAIAIPVFYRFVTPEMGLLPPAIAHVVVFGLIGAAAGLSFGIALGKPGERLQLRAATGGFLGGLCGALIYEVISALVFPDMRVYDAIPIEATERVPRLVMLVSAALCVAAFAVTATQIQVVRAPKHKPMPIPTDV
jgi:hypothetical protein